MFSMIRRMFRVCPSRPHGQRRRTRRLELESLEVRCMLSGFSTFLGGSLDENNLALGAVTVDVAGNSYVVGNTNSSDFPATAGAFDSSHNGGSDAFVAKFNPDGTLAWATFLGGSGDDNARDVAVDTAGNVYVTGGTQSSNFPTTAGAFDTTLAGFEDAFIAKLNPAGAALTYSTYVGGASGTPGTIGSDFGQAIAVDASGNAFVTGLTVSTDFPTTAGAFQTSISNPGGFIEIDAFVLKLNPAGSSLVYSTYLGGSNRDFGADDIVLDALGNAYVVGATRSSNFPVTAGVFQPTSGGFDDGFVTKLNPTGSGLIYSTYLGGGGNFGERVSHIALDSAGNAYVTGRTPATNFPTTTGAFQTTYGGGSYDSFVAKLNNTATALLFSTFLGGSGAETNDVGAAGIALDNSGNVILAGTTTSTNFPTTAGAFQTTLNGPQDAFVAKLNATGSTLIESTYIGGSGSDRVDLMALGSDGAVYLTGATNSTDFPTTAGAFDTTHNGGFDAFVAKNVFLSTGAANSPPGTPIDNNVAANSVNEGAASGTAVGITAFATDPNSDTVTYSLTDSASGRFTIDAATGVVTVANGTLLNYETGTSHIITVQASDGAGGTSTESFTIAISNVNPSTPTDADATANSVAEDAATGTTVGVTASSSDPNGPAVTYSLTNDAGGRFTINSSTGVVTVAAGTLLNFETGTSHSITVQSSDGAGGTSTASFSISVTNVNPTAPADADGAANSVAEGAVNGTAVGVTAASSDPNGPAVTYSLTDSAGGRFAIDSSTGVVSVANGSLLNFDSATSHSITVQADDGKGGISTANFTISVANVAPHVVSPIADVTANEDQANTVLNLSSVFADTHAGDVITLTVSSNSNSALVTASLVGNTLTLDYQPNMNGMATITIRATDAGGLFVEDTFVITVLSASQQLTNLRAIVDQLRDNGVLNQGNANSLSVKLDNAEKSRAMGNTTAAVNQMKAFINEVEAFRKSNKLTDAKADSLIAGANAIIVSLL